MNEKMESVLKAISARGPLEADTSVKGASAYRVQTELFGHAARVMKDQGLRLVAEWAADETLFGRGFAVFAAYAIDGSYLVIKAELPVDDPTFQSLTRHYGAAFRFERQIESLMGLTPAGHPDPRPWIKHEDWPRDAWPLRKSFDAAKPMERVSGEYQWVRAEGEGVFEVPVGPVHAGIIEPGHFRFQAVGENIINLETRFGYVHKGIEKRFEALSWPQAVRLAGRVSGDSTVAHATAFCMALEEASGCVIPERASYIRAIMMERERIANHLGDIGAICNDTALAFLHYQFSILREKVLRTNKAVFGHRLMMDSVCPGGVLKDIQVASIDLMLEEARSVSEEFERLIRIYENNPSMEDRLYNTGVLSPEIAKAIGAVGFVARSSGQALDVRKDTGYAPYAKHCPKVPLLSSGDVHARAWVRVEEVRESYRLMKEFIGSLPSGPIAAEWGPPQPGASGFSAVEGWRGEVVYWVSCGPDGNINRCMVRDASSVNWLAIEQAIHGNIVPDFPLCNKSFNQSYSGHDL
ncbi:hydrogenase, group IVf [uncultured bacterium]|nr:hydrogenase, group IVf [uncultured bacterium]